MAKNTPQLSRPFHISTQIVMLIGRTNEQGTATEQMQLTGTVKEFTKLAWDAAYDELKAAFDKVAVAAPKQPEG